MTYKTIDEEALQLFAKLPDDKKSEIIDFARSLLAARGVYFSPHP